jgi:MoaA/NifB/PqqE/SkfB family radical SAM enzyme
LEETVGRILKWRSGVKSGPVRMELHPTDACNLKCRFCWQTTVDAPDTGRELSEEKLLSIVDEAASMGVKEWIISGGGEPLARKSTTMEILKRIKKLGMRGHLTTNGTLFEPEDVEMLVRIGWDQVQFSIDGPTADIHNHLRRGKDAFERAIKNVRLFSELKKKFNTTKPYVGFNMVLNAMNYDKIGDMIELAHSVGSQLVYIEPIYDGYVSDERLALDEKEKASLRGHIEKAIAISRKLGVSTNADHFFRTELVDKSNFGDTVLAETSGSKADITTAPCFQPWYLMDIKGSGLAGCCSTFEAGEYIHDKTLKEVWFGPTFEKVRSDMIGKSIPAYCNKCSVVVMMDNRKIRDGLNAAIAGSEPGQNEQN